MLLDYKFWFCAVAALVITLYVFDFKLLFTTILHRGLKDIGLAVLLAYIFLITVTAGFFVFLWYVFNVLGFFMFGLFMFKSYIDITDPDDRPYS